MSTTDNCPILVGAGQCVERDYTQSSPMDLAGRAASSAIEACGGTGVAAVIDTIAVIKIFSDSAPMWTSKLGRSNNPPQSVATRIGAAPEHRIYSVTGGNEPQSLLLEFFADLQAGRRDCVLLCGAEAIKNQRNAERKGLALNWTEEFDEPLEDRGFGVWVASEQERNNALIAPVFYYQLLEEFRRQKQGLSREDYQAQMAKLLTSLNAVAVDNPYAQFPGALSEDDILSADLITHLYTKRMVAQDSVNQGAALILTTVAKARELGIPKTNWVYLHGGAEGMDLDISVRPDPSVSEMAAAVTRRTFDMAGKSIDDIALLDIYSCFPVAVTAISEAMGLPSDGSRPLTLTGGLPYFGGPGNNYSMHALAEMWRQVRLDPSQYAYVHANGGLLSKHAGGIFSCQPGNVNWATEETSISQSTLQARDLDEQPNSGTVISYTINYMGGEAVQAVVLCETDEGARFVSHTRPEDQKVVAEMITGEPVGRRITVAGVADNRYALHFRFAE